MYKCECGNETQFFIEQGFGRMISVDNINSPEVRPLIQRAIYLYCHDCDEGGQPMDFQM